MPVFAAALAVGCAGIRAGEGNDVAHDTHPHPEATVTGSEDLLIQPEAREAKGWEHAILWYFPNRILDLFDLFRVRIRLGPGLAVNARITDYSDAYIGSYHTVYLGLPGPRMGSGIRWPVGLEREKGIKLLGVDATDDLPHEPGYSPTEINAGFQVLVVGGEIGFDPVELGDFISGFIMHDPRGDDR